LMCRSTARHGTARNAGKMYEEEVDERGGV
jgi:hypothetical protein